MATCCHFRNLDLFFTFTCSGKWPEIVEDMCNKPSCMAEDRTHIVSKSFKAKINMIEYMKSEKPFGHVESG